MFVGVSDDPAGGMSPDVARANYDLFAREVLRALQAHDVGGDVGVTHGALATSPV